MTWQRWAWGLFTFGVMFLLLAGSTSRDLVNDDVYGAGLASWRIATTGEPWLDGVATEEIGIAETHAAGAVVAANGHVVVLRSPGVVAAGVPAYWMFSEGSEPDDFSLVPGALVAAFFVTISAVLFYSTIARTLSRATTITATLTYVFATPMWSVAANGVWTHTVTTLGISGMAWAASRERWVLVGVFGSIGLWGRVHVSVIVAVLGLSVALVRRQPRVAMTTGLVSLCGLGLASVWSHWVYGVWSPTGGYNAAGYLETVATGGLGSFKSIAANEAAMWLSADRGILVWTPLLLVVGFALVRSWKSLPDWSRYLLIGGVVYTALQGYFSEFHGGDGFYGYRHGLEFLAAAAPAVAMSMHALGAVARRLVGPVIGFQVAAIAIGAISEGFFVRREDAWRDNAFWLALRTVPEVTVWLALMVLVGILGARVWRDRGLGSRPELPAR